MSISDKAGDNAGEASMDEILASIRKIIADDPAASKGGADRRSINPLLEPSAPPLRAGAAADGDGPLLPPAPRFEDALRAGSEALRLNIESASNYSNAAPPSPPVRGRPFVDRALADLLGEGLDEGNAPHRETMNKQPPSDELRGASASALSTPQTPRPASGGSLGSDPWAAWRNLRNAAAPGAANPAALDAQATDVRTSNAAETKTAASGRAENFETTRSAVAASGRPNFGAPVEFSGETQPPALANEQSPASSSDGSAAPSAKSEPIAESTVDPAVVAADTEVAPPSSPAAKKAGFYPPLAATTIRRQPPSFSSAFPRGSGPAADAPSAASPKAATSADATGDRVERVPVERPNTNLLNGHAHSGNSALTNATSRAVLATAAAANQALEKLAAGLSEGAAPPLTAAPQPPAVQILTSPLPPLTAAPSASPPPAQSAGPRTLDDMVSDLLRPMLEKWVESNMPRLMEKALRPGPAKDPNLPKS